MQINSFYINLVSLEDCLGGMYINYIVYLLSLFNYMVLCRVCVKLESMVFIFLKMFNTFLFLIIFQVSNFFI